MNKMELIDEVVEDPSCVFIFPNPDKLRPPLLKIEEGYFGYSENNYLLKGINLLVTNETRIAIVGASKKYKIYYIILILLIKHLIFKRSFKYLTF